MNGIKKVFLVRALDGRIISAITTEEFDRNGKKICCADPQVFLPMNETWSWNEVRWARFDGTKSDPKKCLKGISLPQLVAPVYQILVKRYAWKDVIKKRFLMLWTAAIGLMKNSSDECYYDDMSGVFDPEAKCKVTKGVKCVDYNEPFAPITEALWEEIIYG